MNGKFFSIIMFPFYKTGRQMPGSCAIFTIDNEITPPEDRYMNTTNKDRIVYLDNLKFFLTMLVIVHHVGQAYGPTGGFWHYTSPDKISWLGNFFLLNASFFMGLFFFISGYFMPGAYDRNGEGKFIRERLIRFGLPLLFGFFLLIPAQLFVYHRLQGNDITFFAYYIDLYLGQGTKPAYSTFGFPEFNFGHLWFIEHLLVYSLLYALVRRIIKKPGETGKTATLTCYHIALLTIMTGILTWMIRVPLGFPIDRWIGFIGFIQMEPAHMPQYLIFFLAGTLAYRGAWLDRLSWKPGLILFAMGIAVVLSYWPGRYIFGSAVFNLWEFKEALLAVGISCGLLTIFKFKLNTAGKFTKTLAANSYAAYILHFPLAIAIQILFDAVKINVLAKFIIVSALCITASYGLSFLLRKADFIRKIL